MIELTSYHLAAQANDISFKENTVLPQLDEKCKKYLNIGVSAFFLTLASLACGPGTSIQSIESVSAQTSDILSANEASCDNRITDEATIESRQADAHNVLKNENGDLEATKERMEEYCDGIVPAQN